MPWALSQCLSKIPSRGLKSERLQPRRCGKDCGVRMRAGCSLPNQTSAESMVLPAAGRTSTSVQCSKMDDLAVCGKVCVGDKAGLPLMSLPDLDGPHICSLDSTKNFEPPAMHFCAEMCTQEKRRIPGMLGAHPIWFGCISETWTLSGKQICYHDDPDKGRFAETKGTLTQCCSLCGEKVHLGGDGLLLA